LRGVHPGAASLLGKRIGGVVLGKGELGGVVAAVAKEEVCVVRVGEFVRVVEEIVGNDNFTLGVEEGEGEVLVAVEIGFEGG
jgi:hypothetical protein